MTWVIIFWHKVWNYCPERYGKFQSEIPSTSGAICEKPQGGPLGPPPSGARVNIKLRSASSEMFSYATFGRLANWLGLVADSCLSKLCFRIDNTCLIEFNSEKYPGHFPLSQTPKTWFAHQFWLHLDVWSGVQSFIKIASDLVLTIFLSIPAPVSAERLNMLKTPVYSSVYRSGIHRLQD